MFSWRRKRGPSLDDVIGEANEPQLYVHVSDGQWKALLVERGEIIERVNQQQAIDLGEEADDRLVGVLENLSKSFQGPVLKKSKNIRILLDDPEFVYFESRDNQLPSRTKSVVREIGARHLGARSATLGFRPYPGQQDVDEDSKDGIYILTDVDRLRRNLTILDTRALNVSAIVPVGDLLLEKSVSSSEAGHAVLYLGDYTSFIAISNVAMGVAILRSIPIGIHSLIQRVASESRVSIDETTSALAERDFISKLSLSADLDGESIQSGSAQARAVIPLLGKLLGFVHESFQFFETQFIGGKVRSIEYLGEVSVIKGLNEILLREINLPESGQSRELLPSFFAGDPLDQMNLLKGVDQPLVTVQKISFRYVDQKFVSEQEFSRAQKPAPEVNAHRGRSEHTRLRNRGKKNPDDAEDSRLSISQWLRKFGVVSQSDFASEDVPEADKNERAYFMMLGLILLGLIYVGWMQYDSLVRSHSMAVQIYYNEINQNRRYRDQIVSNRAFVSSGSSESDKVLWSEKFLSLASNMSEAMWITDVYLSDETRKFGENEVVAKKLTVEGAVLPSTDGHIERISEFIGRLLEDEQFFMSDFREITFDGARIDQEEDDHIIRFAIDAWYDENKRVEGALKPSKKSDSPISEMQKKVKSRNRGATNSLTGQVSDN